MIEKTMDFDPKQTKTATISKIQMIFSQDCLLCNNTRTLPAGMTRCSTPWVCDECKEAIAFLKFLKQNDQKVVKAIMEASE